MDVCNGKDTNDKMYEEYATLECKKSTSIDTIAATVHLKIIFYENIDDDQPVALKVSALVIEADTALSTTNINGIYEGYVLRDKVAINSEYLCKKVTGHATATGDNELVRIWLQEARAALTKCTSVNDSNVEKYMYYLQQEKIEAGNEDLSQLVMFTWKMKHPFGQVQLGTIKLFKLPGKLIEQVSVQFIKPLIFSLTAERKHHEQVENIAAENSDVLLKDNQLLLNQLQLMTESRQRDDLRLIARFKEVLNIKKLKLAAKNEELAQLKNQKQHNLPVFVKEEEKVTTEIDNQYHSRGRRKTKSKIVLRKDQTNDNNVVVKRRRQQKIQCDNISNYHISPSVVEQRTTDKYQAKSLQHTDDKQLQEQELMKINLVSRTSIDENVSEEIKTEATPTVPKSVNMLVNNNCFSADTQIDDVPVEENIPSVNILVNNNCFSADTQIDDIPVEENIPSVKMLVNNNCFTADTQIGDIPVEENIPSPSIAKNPIITLNYSQNISSNQNNSCQISKKKSILDNLWSGIL